MQPRFRLVIVLCAALSMEALAQEDAIVVTATRFPERALEAPIGTTIVSRERVAASAATTLPELLSQEAGIVTRDTTGSPDWQVDLRGFGASANQNTLVLLNGQRLNEIELVPVPWSSIALDAIERIEIVRGAGAVLYGGGATGGTINVITRPATPNTFEASFAAALGSRRTRQSRIGLRAGAERLASAFRYSDSSSDNDRQNNRLEQRNFDGELSLVHAKGHTDFKFGLEDQSLGLPGALSAMQIDADRRQASTPRDFATRDGRRASLGGAYDVGFGELAVELGWRDTTRDASLKDYFFGGAFDVFIETRARVWSFAPRLKLPYSMLGMRHSLVGGLDFDDWDYDSRRSRSLETLTTPAAHIRATQRGQAVYFQNNSELTERTRLNLGARWARVLQAINDTASAASYASASRTHSPRAWEAALRHDVRPGTSAYAKIGESFRLSTIDESYSQFGGPAFDAIVTLLEPQTSRDAEAGLELRAGRSRARASAFRMDLRNEIHFFAPTFTNVNLPPTRREGVELEASAPINAVLSAFANATALQATFREGTIGGVDVRGKKVPLVPRSTANAGLTWRANQRTRVSAVVRHVDKQVYENDQANTFPTLMPAFTTADLVVEQRAGRWTVRGAVNNLFDERYYDYAVRNAAGTSFNAYPQRERNFLLTAEYRY